MLPPPIVSQLWVCSAEGMVKPKPYERDEGEDVNKAWMLESIDHLKKQKDANDQELARIQQLTPTEKEEEQRRITAAAAQQVVEASNAVALARATGEDEFQSLALSTMSRGSMITDVGPEMGDVITSMLGQQVPAAAAEPTAPKPTRRPKRPRSGGGDAGGDDPDYDDTAPNSTSLGKRTRDRRGDTSVCVCVCV